MSMSELKHRTSRHIDFTTSHDDDRRRRQKQVYERSKERHSHHQYDAFGSNVFMIVLFIRSLSAYFNLIWDCDETYNYWEPLHFLLVGNGFQTWEYSPEYSLRSYLYIMANGLPIWSLIEFDLVSKITAFYALRFVYAIVTSYVETHMYNSLTTAIGKRVANYYLLFSVTSAGMFLSTTSFLPSTFSMYLVTYAYSSLLRKNYSHAVGSIGLAALVGWPFAALLGVPIVIDILLFRHKRRDYKQVATNLLVFIKYTIIYGLIIAVPLVLVDSYMFGKIVFAPLNIVMYNVFPSKGQGPDLYGREPFSYYIFNGILNFNVLFLAALATPLLVLVLDKTATKNKWMFMSGMFLWMLVFFTRPHKEERFLYPIYPLILACAAISVDVVRERIFRGKLTKLLPQLIVLVHFVLAFMRIMALLKNYSASMTIYEQLNRPEFKHLGLRLEQKEIVNVCTEKEWYRFPSNFFIPETVATSGKQQTWRLRFLESNFKGQLPGLFSESLDIPLSTRYVDKLFNDENKEVRQRYVDIASCDYLLDTEDDNGVEISEIQSYSKMTRWRTLVSLPFLNATRSESLTGFKKLLKSFYIPYMYEKHIEKTMFTRFKLKLRLE